MAKRNTLRQEYYKLGLGHWKTHNGRLNIEYVNWLEDKLVKEIIQEKLEDDEELKELKIKYPPPPVKVDLKKVIKSKPLMIKEDFNQTERKSIKVDPSRVMKSVEGTENNEWFKYFTKLRKK